MMDKKYSKLMFDSSKIYGWIKIWCDTNLDGDYSISKEETDKRIAYTILNDKREIKIDFIKANGGALTIYPKVGKSQDVSEKIAEEIYKRVSSEISKSPYANGFSIKMEQENFYTLINILREYDDITFENQEIQNEPGKAAFETYRIKSSLKDFVVVKYFLNTHRFQIQGKPQYLFNEITSLVCQSVENADSVVDAHIELCNLNVERETLNDELKMILGEDLFNFMTKTHIAMLNTSIILSKVRIEGLDDYSYILQQALRTYEGLTLKMMKSYSQFLGNDKIGEFFAWDNTSKFVMKQQYCSNLDEDKKKLFESMYSFYNKNRHPYMHSSDSDLTTTIISTYDGAIERLNEIIHSLKVSYSKYLS